MSLPNSRIMIHEASRSISNSQVQDVLIKAKELAYKNDVLIEILAKHSGKSRDEIRSHFERDLFLDPTEAKEMGLIDQIVRTQADMPGAKKKKQLIASKKPAAAKDGAKVVATSAL